MADDIVTRLSSLLLNTTAAEAADEIERLRAAGDALAEGIRIGHWDDALDAWDEARRG